MPPRSTDLRRVEVAARILAVVTKLPVTMIEIEVVLDIEKYIVYYSYPFSWMWKPCGPTVKSKTVPQIFVTPSLCRKCGRTWQHLEISIYII